jgi:hypothetical protein
MSPVSRTAAVAMGKALLQGGGGVCVWRWREVQCLMAATYLACTLPAEPRSYQASPDLKYVSCGGKWGFTTLATPGKQQGGSY